jgi:hypothetical protein
MAWPAPITPKVDSAIKPSGNSHPPDLVPYPVCTVRILRTDISVGASQQRPVYLVGPIPAWGAGRKYFARAFLGHDGAGHPACENVNVLEEIASSPLQFPRSHFAIPEFMDAIKYPPDIVQLAKGLGR